MSLSSLLEASVKGKGSFTQNICLHMYVLASKHSRTEVNAVKLCHIGWALLMRFETCTSYKFWKCSVFISLAGRLVRFQGRA
jgi:hypothetical protein